MIGLDMVLAAVLGVVGLVLVLMLVYSEAPLPVPARRPGGRDPLPITTSADVTDRTFARVPLGYDRRAVDAHLRHVRAAYELAMAERARTTPGAPPPGTMPQPVSRSREALRTAAALGLLTVRRR